MALLDIPIDVPWKLVAASKDMMDTEFSTMQFPPQWRSCLAIYAYEPRMEDLPEALCDQQITYLKVSCSISGLQGDQADKKEFYDLTRDILKPENGESLIAVKDILNEYFACYGVLLNVSALPYFPESLQPGIKRVTIDFSKYKPGQAIATPLEENDEIVFTPADESSKLEIVHICPSIANERGEMSIKDGIIIMIPSKVKASRIEGKFCLGEGGGSISMLAYKDRTQLEVKSFESVTEESQILTIEQNDIDRIILKVQTREGGASMARFSYDGVISQNDYPHIVDFEPKKRDLYQAATEEGEILTGSKSEIVVTKSLSHTESSQMGVDAKASAGIGKPPQTKGGDEGIGGGAGISGGISASWGKTNTDTSTTQIDSSRDRRERQAATTQIAQMYNLLTGYHEGTNRAMFLMLPRPHILQPTDMRTFVNGLRVIEGIQDFFLVVSRPRSVPGLFIKAVLDTGHFSEKVAQREPEYDKTYEEFEVQKWILDTRTLAHFNSIYTVREGYVIDTDPTRKDIIILVDLAGREVTRYEVKPDPFHRGVQELNSQIVAFNIKKVQPQNDQVPEAGYVIPDYIPWIFNLPKRPPPGSEAGTNSLLIPGQYVYTDPDFLGQVQPKAGITNYHYQAENSTTVRVEGEAHGDDGGSFVGRYRVFTRSINPKPQPVDDDLVIASRGLSVCIASDTNGCLQVLDAPENMVLPSDWFIVDEPHVKTDASLLVNPSQTYSGAFSYNNDFSITANKDDVTGELADKISRNVPFDMLQRGEMHLPAIKDLLHRIQSSMISSTISVTRRPLGVTRYFDSNYVMKRVLSAMPKLISGPKVKEIEMAHPMLKEKFGDLTIANVLQTDISDLAILGKLNFEDVTKLRRSLLRTVGNVDSKNSEEAGKELG